MKRYDFMKDPDATGSESITVEHAPKRKLDLFPRIACLLLALGIWIYMVNMNDTDMTETITLRIELTGVETLEEAGMMVYGVGERTVTVTVKGTNRDLKQFSESDYKATVEVGGLTEVKTNNLPINIELPKNTSIVLDSAPGNVLVYSDYKEIKAINKISFALGSDAEGDFIGTPSVQSVEISGPKSIVEKIAEVELKVDSELSDGLDVNHFSDVKYLDRLGEEIDVMNAVIVVTKEITVKIEAVDGETDSEQSTDVE
jgi:YbbR domain-containing protein